MKNRTKTVLAVTAIVVSTIGAIVGSVIVAKKKEAPSLTTVRFPDVTVRISLPKTLERAATSDEVHGTVAFVPERGMMTSGTGATVTLTLRDASNPPVDLADAVKRATQAFPGSEEMSGSGDATTGFVVTTHSSHAVNVVGDLPAGPAHRLACTGELAAEVSVGSSWLDDPTAVERARVELDAICRSVRVDP